VSASATLRWNPAISRSLSGSSRPASSSVSAVIVRSLAEAEAFTTADGSTIRELLGLPTAPVRNQSLAEATLEPGQVTERHYHAEAEEIYYVVEGSGEMELEGDRRVLSPGDAVLIPPGAWHQIRARDERLRFLCCCAPAYRHEDTFFA
jgi:mannose-6-phosphate isomerase-like protein (cupin superfamily)